ncbi:hypothetical protein JB92DRAFT_2832993 [Gautieria morchelliformis]|nr:hypothetical protein JB92DRAFT_2832993 [Gautieria morchelliformis]
MYTLVTLNGLVELRYALVLAHHSAASTDHAHATSQHPPWHGHTLHKSPSLILGPNAKGILSAPLVLPATLFLGATLPLRISFNEFITAKSACATLALAIVLSTTLFHLEATPSACPTAMGPASPRRHPYRVHARRGPHVGDDGADAHGASGCTGGAALLHPARRRPPVTLLLALAADTTPSWSRPKRAQPSPTLANPVPTMLHERGPFLLTLMRLANALYTHACVPPLLRFPVMGEGEPVIELVRNELRVAASSHRSTPSASRMHIPPALALEP